MDVARASDQIDRLIERRAGERDATNELQRMYADSARRHRERKRRANRAAWFEFYCKLAANHGLLANEYERKAEELCEPTKGASA